MVEIYVVGAITMVIGAMVGYAYAVQTQKPEELLPQDADLDKLAEENGLVWMDKEDLRFMLTQADNLLTQADELRATVKSHVEPW